MEALPVRTNSSYKPYSVSSSRVLTFTPSFTMPFCLSTYSTLVLDNFIFACKKITFKRPTSILIENNDDLFEITSQFLNIFVCADSKDELFELTKEIIYNNWIEFVENPNNDRLTDDAINLKNRLINLLEVVDC